MPMHRINPKKTAKIISGLKENEAMHTNISMQYIESKRIRFFCGIFIFLKTHRHQEFEQEMLSMRTSMARCVISSYFQKP